jgi:hypothetical protein
MSFLKHPASLQIPTAPVASVSWPIKVFTADPKKQKLN